MLMSLKKVAAPFILRYAASTLRSSGTSADSKDRLWRLVQRHATFLDIGTRATIVNGMKMQVSSRPRVEQEIFLFGEWEPPVHPLPAQHLGPRGNPSRYRL